MEKIKLLAIVERGKGKGNFSCFTPGNVKGYGFAGGGKSAKEAMDDLRVSAEEIKSIAAEKDEALPDVEFEFRFDVGAFFDFYPLDITAVAKYIGMNASALRQYATGCRKPKQKQIDKIREGIEKIAKDLGSGLLIEKPAELYL